MWMMIEAIRAGLAERADPVKAPEMQRYMKSEMPFRGVQKPERVKLARAVFGELSRAEWERVVRTLWHEATFREERYMALAVLQDRRYRAYRDLDALALYEELIVTGAWWDYVDEVACGPLGALLPQVAPVLRGVVGRQRHVEAARVDHRPGPAQGGDRLRADDGLHRTQPRRPRVLHPQGDRLGAALLRLGRRRTPSSRTATRTSSLP